MSLHPPPPHPLTHKRTHVHMHTHKNPSLAHYSSEFFPFTLPIPTSRTGGYMASIDSYTLKDIFKLNFLSKYDLLKV